MFGAWNSGKTSSWARIAYWLHKTQSPSRLFVIDTDRTSEAFWQDWWDEKVGSAARVNVKDVYEWAEYKSAVPSFRHLATRDDFLVVDSVEKAWPKSQRHFIESSFGKGAADWFISWKSEGGKGNPLAGEFGINWNIINTVYAEFIEPIIRWPGHVIACSPEQDLKVPDARKGDNQPKEDQEIMNTFGRMGVRPSGQKDLPYQFHTILRMQEKIANQEWVMTTAKDREREKVNGKKVTDFVVNYLVQVAGWKL